MLHTLSATQDPAPAPPAAVDPEGPGPGPGAILSRLFGVLDDAGVPYCLTHGYEGYPDRIPSDVDCVMPARVTPGKLAALLGRSREALGAEVVQRLDGATGYLILAGLGEGGPPRFVPLDVSPDCRVGPHSFYSGRELLEGRRRVGELWVPPPDLEFGCYLTRKVAKGRLEDDHGRRLADLYARDPGGSRRQVARFWRGGDARALVDAAESGDWRAVRADLPRLRAGLLRRSALRHPARLAWNWAAATTRRARRWCRPAHGLSVAFLGPDGAGKSSVARAVARRWAPAFSRASHRSFPPALRQRGPEVTCSTPHEVPPRSPARSVLRALLYWLIYCGPGYLVTTRPALARLTLVLHDRHLMDTLVDPRRYRYTGPAWVLRLIWRLVPGPDLVILLDAPAEVIWARKREVAPEETARQCAAYRSLVAPLPNGRVVDASLPPERVAEEVDRVILRFLADRVERGLARGDLDE